MKDSNIRNLMPAKKYEEYTATFLEPWDDMLVKRCESLNAHPGQAGALLDVGTGTGVLLEKLLATDSFKNYSLLGIDYYEDNVREANEKFEQRGLPERVSVVIGDAHELQYEDNSFDFVISRATLHHLIDPVRALKEKYRVMKPGGICIIHDMRKDVPEAVKKQFNEMRAQVGYPPTVVEEKYTKQEVEHFLELAGLSDYSTVIVSDSGLAALGYEVMIRKNK